MPSKPISSTVCAICANAPAIGKAIIHISGLLLFMRNQPLAHPCEFEARETPLLVRKMGGDLHCLKRLSRQSAFFECRAGTQAHFARDYFLPAMWTSERRLDRVAAVAMDQFDRRAGRPRHPAIAPRVQHDDQRKKIDTLFGQAILEAARMFL